MDRFVITVNRQFASHGREIAKRLSEILGVPCYDGEMIQEIGRASCRERV